jgi:endonuclease YncB( thermonuclease family)
VTAAEGDTVIDALQVLWTPSGDNLPARDSRVLVDITDGDTPNIRMPIRMLSVDTPEVTARSEAGAAKVDEKFTQLVDWIEAGRAPISASLAAVLKPKLATGKAGTLQFHQGKQASAFAKHNVDARLTRPDGSKRNLFLRTADSPFDTNHRMLAYVAPSYSPAELAKLSRAERATFNLDLVVNGWAAPFVIYPAVPGEDDLPLLVDAAATARASGLGIWGDPDTLLAYEYRAMEKLFSVTKKIVDKVELKPGEAHSWRERYCLDMRSRVLHGPEAWTEVPPEYRLFLWPQDVSDAVSRLNLVPAPELVAVR